LPGQQDRVLLYVKLRLVDKFSGKCIRQYIARMDQAGEPHGHSAMSKLVCIPLLVCLQQLQQNQLTPGIVRPAANSLEINAMLNALQAHQCQVLWERTS
jgi:hypothetical protein